MKTPLLAGAAFAVALVLPIACADGRPSLSTAICVWHDDARGVTCYVAEGKNDEAAIDCIPDAQLERRP